MDENIKPFQLIDNINYQLSRDAHGMKLILEFVFLLLMHEYLLLSNNPSGDSHFRNLHALNSLSFDLKTIFNTHKYKIKTYPPICLMLLLSEPIHPHSKRYYQFQAEFFFKKLPF